MGFWWKPCEQSVNLSIEIHLKLDERSVQLPLCKVNEKHPESGQIYREHHWSWPAQSMISEIKGRRREGNLFIVSRNSAKGNSSPQAVFEKTEGQKRGGLSHKVGRERNASSHKGYWNNTVNIYWFHSPLEAWELGDSPSELRVKRLCGLHRWECSALCVKFLDTFSASVCVCTLCVVSDGADCLHFEFFKWIFITFILKVQLLLWTRLWTNKCLFFFFSSYVIWDGTICNGRYLWAERNTHLDADTALLFMRLGGQAVY